MKNQPLKCSIEKDELVIRIGIDTLKMSAEFCPVFYEYEKHKNKGPQEPYKIVEDAKELALDVSRAMQNDEEDGSSNLSDFLDEMIQIAYEDGTTAFKED